MESILQLKKSNCKNCYKCIRECPIKSIKFADHQANIISDECILCGMCFVACPQNAKQVRDDTGLVREQMAKGRRVVASVAPSFIADFDVQGIGQFEAMLKKLGFAAASETAEGAYLVKSEYERMLAQKKRKVLISSCCHSVNTLIQKYYPEALPYLAHVLSPMQAHAKRLKEEDPEAYVVFIGPCISKKDECDQYGMVDTALTFDDIRTWFDQEGVTPEQVQEDLSPKRSRFFPAPGGIIRSMAINSDYQYIAVDGVENCKMALEEIINGSITNCFVEMNACQGGCINGPATSHYRYGRLQCQAKVNTYADSDKDFEVQLDDLKKEMNYIGVHTQRPGEAAIKEILAKMGKTKPEHELNCGSCGYNTCRDKAVAIYLGKADLSMCLPYLKEKAESFSDKIINNTPNAIFVLDENLYIQQMNTAAVELFKLRSAEEMKNTPVVNIMNPTDFINVVDDKNSIHEKKCYLAEYGKYVEESVIYDKEYHILICIMRDITDQEQEQEARAQRQAQTADITDKVIDKQMRVVQEIASLLGETTAETKIALTKLKDSLSE